MASRHPEPIPGLLGGLSAGPKPGTGTLTVSLLIPAILLMGCGPTYQYRYTPPSSPEGRVCVSQCLNSQQQCWNYNQQMYWQCENNRTWAMQNYYQCRNHAPDQRARNSCWYPQGCYVPSSYYCDENYRGCYQACGGLVDAFRVD